jgi:hypothetical protein
MGRTVPSFRIVIAQEMKERKPFRNALDKKEKKDFDEMFDIPRLYVSACSSSVQLVPLQPIIISILFHHYKELKQCMEDIKQIEGEEKVNVRNNDNQGLTKQEVRKEEQEELTKIITMDSFI